MDEDSPQMILQEKKLKLRLKLSSACEWQSHSSKNSTDFRLNVLSLIGHTASLIFLTYILTAYVSQRFCRVLSSLLFLHCYW